MRQFTKEYFNGLPEDDVIEIAYEQTPERYRDPVHQDWAFRILVFAICVLSVTNAVTLLLMVW